MESTSRKQNTERINRIVGLGVLSAIVVVLQLIGSIIHFGPFSISLVTIPVVVGAALYGFAGGIWLGALFGGVVLLSGDANLFFAVNILGTIVTVLVKGIAAGTVSALVYKLIARKNQTVAAIVAAFVFPVVNTGVFLLGCLCFFYETMRSWAEAFGTPNVAKYMIIGLVGPNFLVELAVSTVFAPLPVILVNTLRKIARRS